METIRHWVICLQTVESKTISQECHIQQNQPSKNVDEIKAFPDKQKLRKYVTSRNLSYINTKSNLVGSNEKILDGKLNLQKKINEIKNTVKVDQIDILKDSISTYLYITLLICDSKDNNKMQ